MASKLDSSLDDIIKKKDSRGGERGERRVMGRAPGGRRGGSSSSRRSTPYARPGKQRSTDDANMGESDLKVSGTSIPNKVAGAICNVVRSSSGNLPGVMATGPAAINQAIKAIAIARKYLLEESPPVELAVQPNFEEDLRSGSNVTLALTKLRKPIDREPSEDDLSSKEKTDCFKLAGAIAGRVRDGQDVSLTTKGPVPVLVAVKAIALAQEYMSEENVDVKFAVKFADLEDPELNNTPSTYLHFAILPKS